MIILMAVVILIVNGNYRETIVLIMSSILGHGVHLYIIYFQCICVLGSGKSNEELTLHDGLDCCSCVFSWLEFGHFCVLCFQYLQ